MQIFNFIHRIIQQDFPGLNMVIKPDELTIRKVYGMYYTISFEGSNARISRSSQEVGMWAVFGKRTHTAEDEFDRLDKAISALLEEHGYLIIRTVENNRDSSAQKK